MNKTIEFKAECKACEGTGIYIGFAEHDGAGIVCSSCKGTGCTEAKIEYIPFTKRKINSEVKHVYQTNPGIGISEKKGVRTFNDFGGMPAKEWYKGIEFPPKSENRKFTCPAWWYQSADCSKKPNWNKCGIGAFSACKNFGTKHDCWIEWDKENEGIGKEITV